MEAKNESSISKSSRFTTAGPRAGSAFACKQHECSGSSSRRRGGRGRGVLMVVVVVVYNRQEFELRSLA